MKKATLYTAFRRLEEDGCIRSCWGDDATGTRRRYYAITPYGREIYRARVEEWRQVGTLIGKLIRLNNGISGTVEIVAYDGSALRSEEDCQGMAGAWLGHAGLHRKNNALGEKTGICHSAEE